MDEGRRVIAVGRDQEKLDAVGCEAFAADVRDLEKIAELVGSLDKCDALRELRRRAVHRQGRRHHAERLARRHRDEPHGNLETWVRPSIRASRPARAARS